MARQVSRGGSPTKPAPKKIVYLWGAGATQGEISYAGATGVNLGMHDSDELGEGIASRIIAQLDSKWRTAFQTDMGIDIEKLISLLASSDIAAHAKLAEEMRRLYFKDICTTLAKTGILSNPVLAKGLLEFHSIDPLKKYEVLSGIITTNHDGLLQVASQEVYGGVNLGIPFTSSSLTDIAVERRTPPILQLHGSFTWAFGVPLRITPLSGAAKYFRDAVWIPPAILKESKSYPFNKLAGAAYELLSKRCDLLRVVGASLTQNDWNVLSLIFNGQRHRSASRSRAAPFRIELIMPRDSGDHVCHTCSYLQNLVPIDQITDGDFVRYRDRHLADDLRNPLFYWLKEKIVYHYRRGDFKGFSVGQTVRELAGGVI